MALTCNVGKADQGFRIVVGLAIIGVGVVQQSWWGAVGIVPLLTGVFRFCPAYLPFKFKTLG